MQRASAAFLNWPQRAVLALLTLFLVGTPSLARASHSDFNSSQLIGDGTFVNTDAMSVSEVQDFLNRKGGFLKDFSENGRSAAQIIVDAAHGVGDASGTVSGIAITTATGTVNPQVILVTLQKEQSLITMTDRSDAALRTAMGYGCPDSGGCNSAYAGFTKQVENGAWQLRFNYERAQGHGFTDFQVGQSFCFSDLAGSQTNCGSYANRATAALYRYTPHVLNGNHNFHQFYVSWFETPVWDAAISSRTAAEHGGVDVAFGPGETRTLTVVMKNTGQESWSRTGANVVKLGTTDSRDRQSGFLAGERNRAATLQESSVAPGGTGTFVVTVTAPSTPGTFVEKFQLVAEAKAWFGQTVGFTFVVPHPGGSYLTQSLAEHPGRFDVAFGPGESRTVTVTMRNSGDSTWFSTGSYPVYLGTAEPHDRRSPFLSGIGRIPMNEPVVIPGGTATFTFTLTDPAPGNGDIVQEHFQLVQEHVAWFGPIVTFKVYNARLNGSYVTQGPHSGPGDVDLVLAAGQSGTLTLRVKNTGDATWFQTGAYPMRLGTASPQDRRSAFLSGGRVSMNEAVVIPGGEATFTIPITASSTTGDSTEHFQLVQDGVTWFGPDISWKVRVQ